MSDALQFFALGFACASLIIAIATLIDVIRTFRKVRRDAERQLEDIRKLYSEPLRYRTGADAELEVLNQIVLGNHEIDKQNRGNVYE